MKPVTVIRVFLLPLLFFSTLVNTTQACSVPVFRYALERWEQDDFVAYVFYRDTIGTAAKASVEELAGHSRRVIDSSGQIMTHSGTSAVASNLLLVTLNLNDTLSPFEQTLWKKYGGKELPWVLVRFPLAARISENLWAGPVSTLPVEKLTASPGRTEMSRRLLAGESVVWIAVKGGNKSTDKKMLTILKRGIDSCNSVLSLPVLDTSDISEYLNPDRPTVRKEFSTIEIDASDPAEELFITMLQMCEPMLTKNRHQPALFPIFGRGRCLFALAGSGMSVEHILEANAFLIGACACTVKEQNPGRDLLLSGDWDSGVRPLIRDAAPPPLQGFEKFMGKR